MSCIIFQTVKQIGISEVAILRLVHDILKQTKQQQIDISVHFVGDRRIKRLNKLYRATYSTTDVLTFAAQEWGMSYKFKDLGDIFIGVPHVRRQAKQLGISFREELYRMIIHGVLHTEGYNHKKKQEATKMFFLQERLLCRHIVHPHLFV